MTTYHPAYYAFRECNYEQQKHQVRYQNQEKNLILHSRVFGDYRRAYLQYLLKYQRRQIHSCHEHFIEVLIFKD
jgi:hypothetical protein